MSDTPLVYMLLLNIAEQKYHEDHESYIFAEKAQPFLQATLFGIIRDSSIIASKTKKITCENLCIYLNCVTIFI